MTMKRDERDRADETSDRPRHRRSLAAGFVLVPVLAFVVVLASGLGRDPRTLPSELIGEPAPTFTLPRLGGGASMSLGSLRGQVVVVNFWASWCLACREEHPDLLAAWERYRERGVVLIGVDFEDTEDAALAYAEEMGGDWPLVTESQLEGGHGLRRLRSSRDVRDRAERHHHGEEGGCSDVRVADE